jgi:small subunit ribosomal protein S8
MQPSPSPPFARRALRGRGQIYITSSLDLKKSSTLKPFLQLISKPGKRIYIGYKNLKDFNNGYKLYILRTSKGIISSQTAIKYKIGGELLMKVLI